MIIKQHRTGIFFKLEPGDFKGAWKALLSEVKKMPDHQYNPPEMPVGENWWWVGRSSARRFLELKKQLIDKVLATEAQYRRDGYRPIPRSGERFARQKLRY